jgi:hypothetical protein
MGKLLEHIADSSDLKNLNTEGIVKRVKSAMNTYDKYLKINRRLSLVRRRGTNRHPPKRISD